MLRILKLGEAGRPPGREFQSPGVGSRPRGRYRGGGVPEGIPFDIAVGTCCMWISGRSLIRWGEAGMIRDPDSPAFFRPSGCLRPSSAWAAPRGRVMGLTTASARQRLEFLDAKHIAIDAQLVAIVPDLKQHVGRPACLLTSGRKASPTAHTFGRTLGTMDLVGGKPEPPRRRRPQA